MVAFNVSALKDFGYDNVTSQLEDPVDPRFRAKPYAGTNLAEVREVLLPGFAKLNAYPNVAKLEKMLDEYWETKTRTETPTTSSTIKPTTTKPTSTKPSTTGTTATTTKSPAPTQPADPYPRCGPFFDDARCPASQCCGKFGWCGSSAAHCSKNSACYSGCWR